MRDQPSYDPERFAAETGASTGDARENDAHSAGFTTEGDRLFRSHFQHVNRLADRSYEQLRPAYQLGYSAAAAPAANAGSFEEIETDLENGWLNVRTAHGDWASVRDSARETFDRARSLGRVHDMPPVGTTPSHDRQSFSDPLTRDADQTQEASGRERQLDRGPLSRGD